MSDLPENIITAEPTEEGHVEFHENGDVTVHVPVASLNVEQFLFGTIE
jgi:hypothetical protein